MTPPNLLYLTILPGLAHAFSGGWTPFAQSALHRGHADAGSWTRERATPDAARPIPARDVGLGRLCAQPNEYEVFFNKASKSGVAVIRNLSPEERAKRALEGEQLEDEIIEIATVMREKADEMVAETGSINFEVIQPMIDEISALKVKYKLAVGALNPEDNREAEDEDGGELSS